MTREYQIAFYSLLGGVCVTLAVVVAVTGIYYDRLPQPVKEQLLTILVPGVVEKAPDPATMAAADGARFAAEAKVRGIPEPRLQPASDSMACLREAHRLVKDALRTDSTAPVEREYLRNLALEGLVPMTEPRPR